MIKISQKTIIDPDKNNNKIKCHEIDDNEIRYYITVQRLKNIDF